MKNVDDNLIRKAWALASSALLFVVSLVALPSTAQAQADVGDWEVNGMVYFFISDVDVTTINPDSSGLGSITIPAGDIAGFVDFAFMGRLSASNGKVGFFSDMIYARLSESASASRDFTVDIPFFEIPANLTADLDVELSSLIWTFGPSVRLMNRPDFELDAIAGVRANFSWQRLDYKFSATVGPITDLNRLGSSKASSTKWDGIVGLSGRVYLGTDGRWSIPLYADFGTGDSKLTYQIASGISYDIKWVRLDLLFRRLQFNSKAGVSPRDLAMIGPQIGVGFKF